MGAELGQEGEWNHERELDWWMLDHWEQHRQLRAMVAGLNRVYRAQPALWEEDFQPEGFDWVDADDSDQSVLSFLRRRQGGGVDGSVLCVANLTPIPRYGYRVGFPAPGRWVELLNTDASEWGGSGVGNFGAVQTEDVAWHGRPWSSRVSLPPLGVLWFTPDSDP
jgi:1,4-alpha-glucan branching enzyme